MKFLCPSCKAKYQIADEKVAGRSVRMKCRKCGFVIPISEIPPAPETMPPEEAGWDVSSPAVPKAPPAPDIALSPAPAPATPASPSPPKAAPAATGTSRVAPVPKPAPKAPSVAGAVSMGAKPPVVRPAVGGAPAPRAPQAGISATSKAPVPKAAAAGAPSKLTASPASAAAAAPAEPAAVPGPLVPGVVPAPAIVSAAAPPSVTVPAGNVDLLPALGGDDDDDDDATRIVKGGALADAFGALVGGPPSGAPPGDLGMPADEWFVGINDVPVGPIRLGEIRKRALLGAVTLDSMVWRDGFEAWRPLKTFPELVAVLEESMSSVRASSAPLIRPAAGAPPPGKPGEPDSLAGASSGITGTGVVTDDYAAAGLNQGRSPIFAWLAIFVALGCGLTIGFVVWSKQKPPETIVKYVEVPAKSDATPAAVAVQDPQAAPAGSAASGATPKARNGSKSSGIAKTPDSSADKGGGLSGLKGLSALGPSGPAVGNVSPGSVPAGGGGQLDGAQTQATVARYTGSVKRSCWQPALDARAPDAPTSARVTVTITVGGTGNVQNVSTSGDPRGYPGLANCIGGRVRAWQFPATGGTTTVNVPFVFAAQ